MPDTARLLSRPRLWTPDEGAPIVVAVGLPGSGKSVLIDQILATRGFVHHAVFSSPRGRLRVSIAGPEAAIRDMVGMAGDYSMPVRDNPNLVKVIDRLVALGPEAAVAVDDIHLADDDDQPTVKAAFDELAAAGVLVVAAGRRLPPWPLAEWRIQGMSQVILDADLAFTLDEAAALVTGDAADPPDWLVELHRRTGGWPAAMAVARDLAGREPAIEPLVADLADHLTSRVLADLADDDERRTLLLASAPLAISERLGDEIGPPGTGRRVVALGRTSAGLTPDPDDPTWYRLHPLLAVGLRRELAVTTDVSVPELVQRVADWHRREGQAVRAAEMLISGRRWDDLLDLLADTSLEFAENGAHRTFIRLFDAAPRSSWERDSTLALHYALMSLSAGQADRAAAVLSKSPITDHDLPPGVAAVADTIRAFMVSFDSPPTIAIEAAERAIEGLEAADEASLPVLTGIRARGPYLHLAGISAGRAENLLYRWGASRRRLSAIAEDPGVSFLVRLNARSALAWVLARRGDLTAAERCAAGAYEAAAGRGVIDHQALAEAHLAIAQASLWRNQVEPAREAVAAAKAAAEHHRSSPQLAAAAILRGHIELRAGHPDAALAALADAPHPLLGVNEAWGSALEARARLRLGDLAGARAVARSRSLGPDTVVGLAETVSPGDDVDVSRTAWTVPDWPSARLHAALAEAIAAANRGEASLASAALRDAIEAARPERLVGPFAELPAVLAAVLGGLPAPDDFESALAVLAGSGTDRSPGGALTVREAAVLRCLGGGLPLNEVAAQLYLSPNTLKTHTRRIYRKLGVTSRSDAVELARRRGLM